MYSPTPGMLDSCVVSAPFSPETDTQDVELVPTVSHQETAIRPIFQQKLCLLYRQWTPVPAGLKINDKHR